MSHNERAIWGDDVTEGRLAAKQMEYLDERRDVLNDRIEFLIARIDRILEK